MKEMKDLQDGKKQNGRKKTFTYEELMDTHVEDLVREAQVQYSFKRQGEYTLEDYYALPEEQRVEMIDGVFYYMLAPYTPHQIAIAEIWRQLDSYIRENGGSCRPMFAPVDVQLDCDDRTMVELEMEQPVPVRIFDGKCQIRFDELCEDIRPVLRQP